MAAVVSNESLQSRILENAVLRSQSSASETIVGFSSSTRIESAYEALSRVRALIPQDRMRRPLWVASGTRQQHLRAFRNPEIAGNTMDFGVCLVA